jgi:hypothetical protein
LHREETAMIEEHSAANVEALLGKARKPSSDAMRLHPFYRGDIETALKCSIRDSDDMLTQISAVRAGLDQVGRAILEYHMTTT